MSETKHTPPPWHCHVRAVSCGLEETGYSHFVIIGGNSFAVSHHRHKNYDHIHQTSLMDGCVRKTGIGRREPDLSPCADALLIASAPDLLEALQWVRKNYAAGKTSEINAVIDAAVKRATEA